MFVESVRHLGSRGCGSRSGPFIARPRLRCDRQRQLQRLERRPRLRRFGYRAVARRIAHRGYYTPADYAALESGDTDLGSTAPALLPREKRSRTPLLAVQGGKDALLRLLDRAHLGGVGGELQHVDLGDRLFSAPAVWNDGNVTSIIVGLPSGLKSYRLRTDAQGVSRLVARWTTHLSGSTPEGTSPVIVNGVVFVASSGALLAFDARTGRALCSADAAAGGSIGDIHWQSPIAVNGAVYCSDQDGHLTAYTLPR